MSGFVVLADEKDIQNYPNFGAVTSNEGLSTRLFCVGNSIYALPKNTTNLASNRVFRFALRLCRSSGRFRVEL